MISALALSGLFALPAAAKTDIHVSLNLGAEAPHIYMERGPRLVRIPDSRAYYAQDYADCDLYQYQGDWYSCQNGAWFRAGNWRGPWVAVSVVPGDVYNAPSGFYRQRHFSYDRDDRGDSRRWRNDDNRGRGHGWGRWWHRDRDDNRDRDHDRDHDNDRYRDR